MNQPRGGRRDVLTALRAGLGRAAHVVTGRPGLVFPQLYNRLITDAQAQPALLGILESYRDAYPRPWLRLMRAYQTTAASCLHTLTGHQAGIRSCAVLPDGRRAVSVDDEGTLVMWDLADRRELARHQTESPERGRCDGGWKNLMDWESDRHRPGRIDSFVVGSCGSRGAIDTIDGLLLFDLQSGGILERLDGYVARAASPHHDRLVIESREHELQLWDLKTGSKCIMQADRSDDWSACQFSSDGTRAIACSAGGAVYAWRASDGAILSQVPLQGQMRPVVGCVLDSDTGRIAVQSLPASDGAPAFKWAGAAQPVTTTLFDLSTGRPLAAFTGEVNVLPPCAFDATTKRFVVGVSDKDYVLASSEDGSVIQRFTTGRGPLCEAHLVLAGTRLIARAVRDGDLYLYDLEQQREFPPLKTDFGPVTRWRISPDGGTAATLSRYAFGNLLRLHDAIRIWDLGTGRERVTLRGHTDRVSGFAFLADGQRLLSASLDRTLKVWDLEMAAGSADKDTETIRSLSCRLTPDGQRVAWSASSPRASGGADAVIRMWETGSGNVAGGCKGHDARLSPNGRVVAVRTPRHRGFHGTLLLLDPSSGLELGSVGDTLDPVRDVAFDPSGQYVCVVGDHGGLVLWDLGAKTGPRRFADVRVSGRPLGSRLSEAVTWSADGSVLLFTPEPDELSMLSVESGTVTRFVFGHTARLTDFGCSRDGRVAYSAGEDDTVRIWDTESGLPMRTFEIAGPRLCRLSGDGRRLAVVCDSAFELRDVDAGDRLLRVEGVSHAWAAVPVLFSPDGRWLVVPNIFVSVHDSLRAGAKTFRFDTRVYDSVDGREVASYGGAGLQAPPRVSATERFYAGVSGVAISPDGRHLLLAGDCVTLWDVAENGLRAVLYDAVGRVPDGAIDFDPDGRTFVAGDELGQVFRFSLENVP